MEFQNNRPKIPDRKFYRNKLGTGFMTKIITMAVIPIALK